MISQEAIKEFKDLFFKKFSIELTDEEVLARVTNTMNLFNLIYRPFVEVEDEN